MSEMLSHLDCALRGRIVAQREPVAGGMAAVRLGGDLPLSRLQSPAIGIRATWAALAIR